MIEPWKSALTSLACIPAAWGIVALALAATSPSALSIEGRRGGALSVSSSDMYPSHSRWSGTNKSHLKQTTKQTSETKVTLLSTPLRTQRQPENAHAPRLLLVQTPQALLSGLPPAHYLSFRFPFLSSLAQGRVAPSLALLGEDELSSTYALVVQRLCAYARSVRGERKLLLDEFGRERVVCAVGFHLGDGVLAKEEPLRKR